MAMVFSFLNCYCDDIMSKFKSFQVAHRDSVYTGRASLKDWHDRGVGWVQRIFLGRKFWFELIFFLICELHQDFCGLAKIGWDFLEHFYREQCLAKMILNEIISIQKQSTLVLHHTPPPPPPTQAIVVNSTCNIQSTRKH